jgi:hypothetical protein
MDGVKTLTATLEQDSHEIDDDLRVAGGGFNRRSVPQIGLDGIDLSDTSERLQVPGQFRPADGDANAIVALGERANHMAA